MAAHSSVLAWRIPGTEEPCGLPSMGSHRVWHDWSNLAVEAAVHLYVNRNLNSFHVLAIVNTAASNMGVFVSFELAFIFSECVLNKYVVNHMVTLFLDFWGPYIPFSIVAALIYIPTNSTGESPFLHTLSIIYYS